MVRCIIPLMLMLLSLVAADNKAIRYGRRRTVLQVDSREQAAELLDSLWEANGIEPKHRDLKGSTKTAKGIKQSEDSSGGIGMSMSLYYY